MAKELRLILISHMANQLSGIPDMELRISLSIWQGDTVEDLLEKFKDLGKEDILACLAYAAQMANTKTQQIITI